MAASPWKVFNSAKRKLGTGGINLSVNTDKRITLFQNGASALIDTTISVLSSIGAFTVPGSLDSKEDLSNVTWTGVASLNDPTKRWDGDDCTFTASGATLSGVRIAVIWQSVSVNGGPVIAYSSLSTAAFDVSTGNTLTIQMNASGIFTLA